MTESRGVSRGASVEVYMGATPEQRLSHLQGLIEIHDTSEAVKNAAQKMIQDVQSNIYRGLLRDEKKIGSERKELQELMKYKEKGAGKKVIEENIRKQKLNEQNQRKKELEQKLKMLNENIDMLQGEASEMDPGVMKRKGSLKQLGEGALLRSPLQKKEEMERKLQEAQGLVQKMKEEQMERKKREALRKKEQREKLKMELAKVEEIKQNKEEEAKRQLEERERKLHEKLEKMRIEREEREKMIKEETKKLAQKKERLYMKLEQNFSKNIEQPELERRKKELAEKRSLLAKPLDHHEWEEHSRRADELAREKLEQKKIERLMLQQRMMEDGDRNRLQSYSMQKVIDDERKAKELRLLQEKEKIQMIDRKKQYAEKVKDLHKPHVSEKKRLELQILKQNLKHPVRQPKRPKSHELSQKPGVHFSRRPESQSEIDSEKPLKKRIPIARNMSAQPPPERKKPVDYLQEIRNQRLKKMEDNGISVVPEKTRPEEWTNALHDNKLSMKEKYDRVTAAAKHIEQQAGRMELIERVNNSGSIQKTEDINDRYVEAIRAKLALLENL